MATLEEAKRAAKQFDRWLNANADKIGEALSTLSPHEWAVEVDTYAAEISKAKEAAHREFQEHVESIHRVVNDKKVIDKYGTSWQLSDREAIFNLGELATHPHAASDVSWAIEKLGDNYEHIGNLVRIERALFHEYVLAGEWSRFFLVPGGHVHSSTDCSTCNNGKHSTTFYWLPELSGLTEADAVASQGAILCTVCFPSAPVEWTNQYELEAAAKANQNCPGSRDWSGPSREGYYAGNWGTCDTCGQHVALTRTGKIRAHKKVSL